MSVRTESLEAKRKPKKILILTQPFTNLTDILEGLPSTLSHYALSLIRYRISVLFPTCGPYNDVHFLVLVEYIRRCTLCLSSFLFFPPLINVIPSYV